MNGGAGGHAGRVDDAEDLRRERDELRRTLDVIRGEQQAQNRILDVITDSVVVTGLDGRIRSWNRGAERVFGYRESEMIGRTPAVLYPDRTPESLASDLQSILAGIDYHGEWRGVRKDGGEVWVQIRTTLLRDEAGRPQAFIGVAKDVTERRAAEHARAALETRQRLRNGQLRDLAAAAVSINGAGSVDLILRELAESAREIIGVQAASASTTVTDASIRPVVRTDSRLTVPLIGTDGRALGLVELADKVTGEFNEVDADIVVQLAQLAAVAIDNAKLLDLVRAEKARAEAASQAKDEFLAMLGHELRNPLSPILTVMQLVERRAGQLLPREQAIIDRQVRHLVRLVDDLLDVSRITRGKLDLKRQVVLLDDVAREAMEQTSPLVDARQQTIDLVIRQPDLLVDGDPDRLAQILANLLTNAAKFSPPGGRVEVSIRRDGHWAVVQVRDWGSGIQSDLLPRVFDLFVQGHRSAQRAEGGLGLGLTIVKCLAHLHGGLVSAHSAGPGAGSSFVVRLPLSAAPPQQAFDSETTRPGVRASLSQRVLVVDDNRDAADLLGEALRAAGHVVDVAFDPAEAVARASEVRPDVAVLDIGLPGIDGYELGRLLHELPGGEATELVAVTGYGQASDRDRSRRAGFAEHMVKPVDLDQLLRVIDQFAPRAAAQRPAPASPPGPAVPKAG